MLIEYNLGKFESLEDVSKRFSVSIMDIKQCNGISGDNIPKTLYIPKRKSDIKVIANLQREYVTTLNYDAIKTKFNSLNMMCVNPQDNLKLFVPKQNNIYVVTALDNLNSVCKKLGVEKQKIIQLNNLKSEKLFIGQLLILS